MPLKHRRQSLSNFLKIFGWLLAFTPLIMVLGCGDPTGTLEESAELTQNFSQNGYRNNYTYYYIGRENTPTAIIGIDNKFVFEPDFWQEFPSDSAALNRLIGRLSNYTREPRGYYLLGPEGQEIGVLLSVRGLYAVKIKKNGKVQILASGFMDPSSG
jgi:hypothetical protein